MGSYCAAAGSTGQYQSEFYVNQQGGAQALGTVANGNQITITVLDTNDDISSITDATVIGENSIQVDQLIDTLQNTLRDRGYGAAGYTYAADQYTTILGGLQSSIDDLVIVNDTPEEDTLDTIFATVPGSQVMIAFSHDDNVGNTETPLLNPAFTDSPARSGLIDPQIDRLQNAMREEGYCG